MLIETLFQAIFDECLSIVKSVFDATYPTLERLLNCEALASNLTCILGTEPGKLDIKRHKPG